MSNPGTVPEKQSNDGKDEASTKQTDVESTQQLVDSMLAMNQSLGQPIFKPTAARFANFQRTHNASEIWRSMGGNTSREPAIRQAVQEVLKSLREEKSQVS